MNCSTFDLIFSRIRLAFLLATALALPLSNASAIVTWGDMEVEADIVAKMSGDAAVIGQESVSLDASNTSTPVPASDGSTNTTTEATGKFEILFVDDGEGKSTGSVFGDFDETTNGSDNISASSVGTFTLSGWFSSIGTGEIEDIDITFTFTMDFTVDEAATMSGDLDLLWLNGADVTDDVDFGYLEWKIYNNDTDSIVDYSRLTVDAVDSATNPMSGVDLEEGTDYSLILSYEFFGVSFSVGSDSNDWTEVEYEPWMSGSFTTVPEPASGALLTAAFAGLLLRRRRKS